MPTPDVTEPDDPELVRPGGEVFSPPEPRDPGVVTELLRASRAGAPDAYARVSTRRWAPAMSTLQLMKQLVMLGRR